jgi:hypothetical protein
MTVLALLSVAEYGLWGAEQRVCTEARTHSAA